MAKPNIIPALAQIESLVKRGSYEQAEAECRQLLGQAPTDARIWDWLGVIALEQNRMPDAEQAFREATKHDRNNAGYCCNLGLAILTQHKPREAEQCFRRALKLNNSLIPCWDNLAACLVQQGRWSEAADAARESLGRNPQNAIAWSHLGDAEHGLRRLPEAQQALERSMAIEPGKLGVITKFALVLADRGQLADATQILRDVLVRDPYQLYALIGLGGTLRAQGHLGHSIYACERAVEMAPTNRDALLALAFAQYLAWFLPEAEATLRRLLAVAPESAHAWSMLATVLSKQAKAEEASAAFRRSVELAPDAELHSTLLANLSYAEGTTLASLLAEHRAWDERYARPLLPAVASFPAKRDANRPLRIGIVSTDLGVHAVGFLSLPAIEHLDKSQCSLVFYSDRIQIDEYTTRFQAAANTWRDTRALSNDELAEQIKKDEIDVLFDLMGHNNPRILTFAKKPAPLQITWLGYVGTTGMGAMDCLLADRFHVQPGEEAFYTESIIRMPHGYACYGPLPNAPPVEPLSALRTGVVTFGCFNNPTKFTARMFEAWSEILRRLPSARLLLKYGGLDKPQVQELLRAEFTKRGVDGGRITFAGWSPVWELLGAYGQVDIALDTQPYSGGVTTCEALWMGVPVITCPGQIFASRHATSHLTNAGFGQFVASNPEQYVELAVAWANRMPELATLRSEMRKQVQASPLCDAAGFARDFLALLQQTWVQKVTAGAS